MKAMVMHEYTVCQGCRTRTLSPQMGLEGDLCPECAKAENGFLPSYRQGARMLKDIFDYTLTRNRKTTCDECGKKVFQNDYAWSSRRIPYVILCKSCMKALEEDFEKRARSPMDKVPDF